jgi:hypothetical protein
MVLAGEHGVFAVVLRSCVFFCFVCLLTWKGGLWPVNNKHKWGGVGREGKKCIYRLYLN